MRDYRQKEREKAVRLSQLGVFRGYNSCIVGGYG